jgi:hypothetical protein
MFNQELYASAFARAVQVIGTKGATKDQQKAALRALVALAELSAATLRLYEGGLSVDDISIPPTVPYLETLTRRMQVHRVTELLIGRQSEPAELLALLRGLAAQPGEGGTIKERLRDAHSKRIMVVLEAASPEPGRRVASVTQAFDLADIEKAETAAMMDEWEKMTTGTSHEVPLDIGLGADATSGFASLAETTTGQAPEAPAEDEVAPALPLGADTPLGAALSAVVLDPYGRGLLDRLTDLSSRVLAALAEDRVEDALRALSIVIDLEPGAPEGTPRNSFGIVLKRTLTRDVLTQIAQLLLNPALMDPASKVLLRARTEGAEVLLGLLATAEGIRDRKAYMSVLRQTQHGTEQVLRMLGHDQWFVVRNVAELAGEMQLEEAVGDLGKLLTHGDMRVRRAAAVALARIGNPATVEPLRRALKEGAPDLRALIAANIGRASRALAMPLVALAEAEQDQEVLKEYCLALGRIGTPDCVQALQRMAQPGGRLLGRKPLAPRLAAVQGLKLASAAAALQTFADDTEKVIRDTARQALLELDK